jgi:uncharacterized protein (PEP-CTERM system associated)
MVKTSRAALLPLAAALCSAFPAHAAWDFTPIVGARITWSDNIGQRADSEKESGWARELSPGFSLSNETPRLQARLDYSKRFYTYSGGRPQGNQGDSQELNGMMKAKVVEDLLFLDATASIHQSAVSPYGPVVSDMYSGQNTSEVRTLMISPYVTHRFGAFADGLLRYTHDSLDTDNVGMRRSEGNTILAHLSSGASFRRFIWDGLLTRQVVTEQLSSVNNPNERGADQSTGSKNANLNVRYVATPQLNVGVFGGYDDYDFQGLGGKQGGAAYGANVQWTPSSRTSLQASAGHRFYGPSYSLQLQHRSRATAWNVAYTDAVSTSRSQFLLPAAINTAAMLDNLFRATISDPALRAAAVQAYMKEANLPPTLANNINFFSNRYALDKQLSASMAWTTVRTTTMFSVVKSRREALSAQAVDSPLLGSNQYLYNDNTEQLGASVMASYRFGPQTLASLSGSAYNVKSLTDSRNTHHRELRFNLSRSIGKRAATSLEVRRNSGTRAFGGQDFTENAVTFAITSKF